METTEIIEQIKTKIHQHDADLVSAPRHTNAHAYHLGQINKYSRAMRILIDAAEADTRFSEIETGN